MGMHGLVGLGEKKENRISGESQFEKCVYSYPKRLYLQFVHQLDELFNLLENLILS